MKSKKKIQNKKQEKIALSNEKWVKSCSIPPPNSHPWKALNYNARMRAHSSNNGSLLQDY